MQAEPATPTSSPHQLRFYPPEFGHAVAGWPCGQPVPAPSARNLVLDIDDLDDGAELFRGPTGKPHLGDTHDDARALYGFKHTPGAYAQNCLSGTARWLPYRCSSKAAMWEVLVHLSSSRRLRVRGKAWRRLLHDLGLWPVSRSTPHQPPPWHDEPL